MVDFKIKNDSLSISQAKKNITLSNGMLEMTNEYGNSLKFEMSDSQFSSLFANLWQFVKDSQH